MTENLRIALKYMAYRNQYQIEDELFAINDPNHRHDIDPKSKRGMEQALVWIDQLKARKSYDWTRGKLQAHLKATTPPVSSNLDPEFMELWANLIEGCNFKDPIFLNARDIWAEYASPSNKYFRLMLRTLPKATRRKQGRPAASVPWAGKREAMDFIAQTLVRSKYKNLHKAYQIASRRFDGVRADPVRNMDAYFKDRCKIQGVFCPYFPYS